MTSHQIRLRRSWECRNLQQPDEALTRLDLPISTDLVGRLPSKARLTRKFQWLKALDDFMNLELRLENVPGLHSLQINRQSIALPHPLPDPIDIPVELLARTNEVALEVDFEIGLSVLNPNPEGWGHISLVLDERQRAEEIDLS